jgi:hypothetical protein
MSTPFVDSGPAASYQTREPEGVPIGQLPDVRLSTKSPMSSARVQPITVGQPPGAPAPSAAFPEQRIGPTAVVVMLHMTTYGAVIVRCVRAIRIACVACALPLTAALPISVLRLPSTNWYVFF